LSTELAKGDVTVNASPPDTGPGLLELLLVGFGPVLLLLIAAFVWLSRRASSLMGSGPLSAFTRARARRVEGEATYTTFADVAGIDDAGPMTGTLGSSSIPRVIALLWLLLLVPLVVAVLVQRRLRSVFARYRAVGNRAGVTGAQLTRAFWTPTASAVSASS
jgi:hypothetical protein